MHKEGYQRGSHAESQEQDILLLTGDMSYAYDPDGKSRP